MHIKSENYILEIGRSVLKTAADGLLHARTTLNDSFVQAAKLIATSTGKIVFSGIGKSGIIAEKLSFTMCSTGTFAHYIHPVDALHGDLGMIQNNDIIIILSRSGNTSEIIVFLEYVKKLGFNNKIVAITARKNSVVCKYADITLFTHIIRETTYKDLMLYHIPTTSTTVTLALGDALIYAVYFLKGSEAKNIIKFHPGGNIGKLLSKE